MSSAYGIGSEYFAVATDYECAQFPGMEAQKTRAALQKFIEARKLKIFPWAKSAGVNEGTLRAFLSGKTASMRHDTLAKLAAAEQTTVADMLGEKPQELRVPRDAVIVKGLKVEASMGGGVDVSDESEGEAFYFRRVWLEERAGKTPGMLRVIQLKGDSMEPTLHDGDVALVQIGVGDVTTEPGIYCLWDGHGLIVKRLQVLPGKAPRLRILSDNGALYPPTDVRADDVRIIGRVIWRGGDV